MSTVPAAPPIKYVLGYRSRTINPNPITDHNPNPKPKNNTALRTREWSFEEARGGVCVICRQ